MLNKLWIGALVINGCLVLSSGNLHTLTTFLTLFIVSGLGYLYYKERG